MFLLSILRSARLPFPMSFLSVALVSSCTAASALTFDPCEYFVFSETPVLPKPVTWYSLQGSFAHASVDPRHGNLQQVSYFMNT